MTKVASDRCEGGMLRGESRPSSAVPEGVAKYLDYFSVAVRNPKSHLITADETSLITSVIDLTDGMLVFEGMRSGRTPLESVWADKGICAARDR
jgi:hypothetical protein